jgi:carbon monoxide dehydrogenase subunit G
MLTGLAVCVVSTACGGGSSAPSASSSFSSSVGAGSVAIREVTVPKDSVLLVTVMPNPGQTARVHVFVDAEYGAALGSVFSTDASAVLSDASSASETLTDVTDSSALAAVHGVEVDEGDSYTSCDANQTLSPARALVPAPAGAKAQIVVEILGDGSTSAGGSFQMTVDSQPFNPGAHTLADYSKALTAAPFATDFVGSHKFCNIGSSIN